MKKLFIIAAIVLSLFKGYSQNNHYAKSAMVVLVTEAQKTYTKATTYDNWVKAQIGTVVPTAQETNLLKDIYGFVSNDSKPETIFKNYNGLSFQAMAKTKNSVNAFSETNRCGFWCSLIFELVYWYLEVFEPGTLP